MFILAHRTSRPLSWVASWVEYLGPPALHLLEEVLPTFGFLTSKALQKLQLIYSRFSALGGASPWHCLRSHAFFRSVWEPLSEDLSRLSHTWAGDGCSGSMRCKFFFFIVAEL